MTFWARLDADGPWLESELLVGSSSFELRPRAPAVSGSTVAYDSVARVQEPHPVPAPGERTIEVATFDGRSVAVRGPAAGMVALETSLRSAVAVPVEVGGLPGRGADGDGADGEGADGEGADGEGAGPPPGVDTSRRSASMMAGIVGVLVVLIAFWTYHADQGELAAKARARRSAATSTTTTTEPAMPEARVEGATTVPTSPTSLAPTARPTSTTSPVTSSTVAGQAPVTTSAPATPVAPTTVAGATPTGPLHTFIGTVTLRQAQSTDGGATPACAGIGGLRDITTGATITVLDASGQPVATGTLGACRFVPPDIGGIPGGPPPGSVGTGSVLPQFDILIPNVPDSGSYTLRVLHYDPVGFTKAELGNRSVWRVSIAISL